jgi:hypothetical protein
MRCRQGRFASFMVSSDLLVSRGSSLLSGKTLNAHNATAASKADLRRTPR